jgi:hypothetical protein
MLQVWMTASTNSAAQGPPGSAARKLTNWAPKKSSTFPSPVARTGHHRERSLSRGAPDTRRRYHCPENLNVSRISGRSGQRAEPKPDCRADSARAIRPLGCPASRSGDPDQCGKMPHFFAFLMCATFLGIETSDSKAEEKQSHLSHLSPLSHFQVLQWLFWLM